MTRFPFYRKNDALPASHHSVDLFSVGKEDPLFNEKIKGLRAMVEQKADLQQMRLLGITSSIAGEGKTTICGQLGRSLASTGRKKVLLVDVDVRKADLTHRMGARRTPGLTEFLLGGATLQQIVHATQVPNLFLITSGTEVNSPADLLSGDKFKAFLREIRGSHDMILLDTPPLLPVADTPTIRDQTDGFLLVYRVGSTPYTMLRQAMEELGEKNVLGAVLNGVEVASDSYYQKYYGAYYHRDVKAVIDSAKTREAVRS
ncbi:MAG: polysaccharide biosynthesis tyrosine autokinase [Deltaproteobacteria bacterium]|nr:MAG: polysaccharide biosynthesis tyrosine autokinase [Deltaproteobacteria bacterium]